MKLRQGFVTRRATMQGVKIDPGVPLAQVLAHARARPEGLTSAEAESRLLANGPNETAPPTSHPNLLELGRSLASPLILVLVSAAVAALFLGQTADALIILTMVVLSTAVNFWQSARSAKAVQLLEKQLVPSAMVLRDGAWNSIPRREVVVGDMVRLGSGDLVPADARLLESTDLHVQQAALTGEPFAVEKRASPGVISKSGPDAAELLFTGTSIVSGTAVAVVFAAGLQTAYGEIAARIAERPEPTAFERGLQSFGFLILQTVIVLVLLVLIANLAMQRDPMQSLLFAVALAVGLTPEYLPMITTVTLVQGAVQMARHRVIVRHLSSIQNLGSIDILCCDKTGTLTSGVMQLDQSLAPDGTQSTRPISLGYINSTLQTGVQSPLDTAIREWPAATPFPYRKVGEIPFDFERRRLSVLVTHETGGPNMLITKGAPEGVLACCTGQEVNGEVRRLDPAERESCLERFRKLSRAGFRVLAVAYRETGSLEQGEKASERDLVFAGFLSFADSILQGVDTTILGLHALGVSVKILSGDNELVTRTLCQQVGIDADEVITGDKIERLDLPALGRLAERHNVFARVSPAQKHRIVMALKHRRHVVGFIGDGINDAPSLHGADVGIAAAGAVDVAREASDILLMDRGLGALRDGIVAGRQSFANVLKYILMGTSSNFGNMISMAGATLVLPFLPMLPTQILVNNFLYDVGQVTIPSDRVDPAWVNKPHQWDMKVVRTFMLVVGPVSSLFDALTFMVLLWIFRFAEAEFQTAWFVESLATQVLVIFVIRTAGRPWSNRPSKLLAVTVCLSVLFALVLPFTPLAPLLGMAPLPLHYYGFVAVIVTIYLAFVEFVKRKVMGRLLLAN